MMEKPDNLGVSVSLWKDLSADLNTIYTRRRRIVWIGYVIALIVSWPLCNLVFADRWWTMILPIILFGMWLRHELTFTSDCFIPLTFTQEHTVPNDDDLDPFYVPFQRVSGKYTEQLASHGVRATVMSDEPGSAPQRAYLIFSPAIERGSEGLYFV